MLCLLFHHLYVTHRKVILKSFELNFCCPSFFMRVCLVFPFSTISLVFILFATLIILKKNLNIDFWKFPLEMKGIFLVSDDASALMFVP